jgi:hypothetical protein
MEFKVKRGFFDRCHDYISSYLKEVTSTESDDDGSSSGDDSDCCGVDDDDTGCGNVVKPSFRMAGPYKKVATKDRRWPVAHFLFEFSCQHYDHNFRLFSSKN